MVNNTHTHHADDHKVLIGSWVEQGASHLNVRQPSATNTS